ncbi:hypothetical protein SBDP2_1510003 [Syntrophobacter sp. SbD2]|nr:hypothetical protein SBDP2_1510003 [Syntrophobacter sp. SbD2]
MPVRKVSNLEVTIFAHIGYDLCAFSTAEKREAGSGERGAGSVAGAGPL